MSQEPVPEGGDTLGKEELVCSEILLFFCLISDFILIFKSKTQVIQPELQWLLFMYGKYLTVQVRKPKIQKLKGNPKLLGSSNQTKNIMRTGSLRPDTNFLQQWEGIKAVLKHQLGTALTFSCHLLPGPLV